MPQIIIFLRTRKTAKAVMSHFDSSDDELNAHCVFTKPSLLKMAIFKKVRLFDHICYKSLNPHYSQKKVAFSAVQQSSNESF